MMEMVVCSFVNGCQVSSGGVISTVDGAVGCPVGVALSVSGSVYISDMCSSSIYVVSDVVGHEVKCMTCGTFVSMMVCDIMI